MNGWLLVSCTSTKMCLKPKTLDHKNSNRTTITVLARDKHIQLWMLFWLDETGSWIVAVICATKSSWPFLERALIIRVYTVKQIVQVFGLIPGTDTDRLLNILKCGVYMLHRKNSIKNQAFSETASSHDPLLWRVRVHLIITRFCSQSHSWCGS